MPEDKKRDPMPSPDATPETIKTPFHTCFGTTPLFFSPTAQKVKSVASRLI